MENQVNPIFDKFMRQRLKFTGTLSASRKPFQKDYRISRHRTLIFKNVYWNDILFRDHVHIQVSKGFWNELYNKTQNAPFGKDYEFTAELYRYTKNPSIRSKEIARSWGVGLKDIGKLSLLKKDKHP